MADSREQTTLTITSKVERQPGRFRGTRSTTSYESQKVAADGSRQRRFTAQLNMYYDAVIACVCDAETVLIFGPGEAKGEFRKRIMETGIRGHVEEAETVDKMTDRQVAAKVRRYFQGDWGNDLRAEQRRQPAIVSPSALSDQPQHQELAI
jgi:hypothetical protein